MDDCRTRLLDYIKQHGLRAEQGATRLDETLKEAMFPGAKERPDVISMKDLNSRFEKQLVAYSAIVFGDNEPVFSKGTPPNIEVIVDKVGQKLRTRIKNLEAFGLDPLGTIASGALLMTLAPAEAGMVIHALAREAIDCHFIGQVVPPEQGVMLAEGTRQWPLPTFARDEIAKLFGETPHA